VFRDKYVKPIKDPSFICDNCIEKLLLSRDIELIDPNYIQYPFYCASCDSLIDTQHYEDQIILSEPLDYPYDDVIIKFTTNNSNYFYWKMGIPKPNFFKKRGLMCNYCFNQYKQKGVITKESPDDYLYENNLENIDFVIYYSEVQIECSKYDRDNLINDPNNLSITGYKSVNDIDEYINDLVKLRNEHLKREVVLKKRLILHEVIRRELSDQDSLPFLIAIDNRDQNKVRYTETGLGYQRL